MTDADDETAPDWLLAKMENFAEEEPLWDISNRDHALFLLGDYDLDAQLIAIKGVLRKNKEAEAEVADAIKALDARIRNYAGDDDEYQIHMENHWVDTLHGTVFQDAAHSMSAVGMLAPFTESMLVSIFRGLRKRWAEDGRTLEDSARGPSSTKKFWDPQWLQHDRQWKKAGQVQGTRQLAETIGLLPYFPDDFSAIHAALSAYRNLMFHNGFEWPMDERRNFGSRITEEGWPSDWFKKSTTGGDPWIFYLSEEFVAHCLRTIDEVLEGTGRYLKELDG